VVVERVAGKIAREAAPEQGLEIVERRPQRREIDAGIARGEEREYGVADLPRVLDVHAIGDVVLVETVLNGDREIMRGPSWKAIREPACKPGSVRAARVAPRRAGSHSSGPGLTPGL